MNFGIYILLHSFIDLILIIKFIFGIYLLIVKYEDYIYTFKIMIVIISLISDIIPIVILTSELMWSLFTTRIVSCSSDPPFYGDDINIPLFGHFRPYYFYITIIYLIQTIVISIMLATRGSSLIPIEILALSIWTFVLLGINIITTLISCIVIIK